MHAGGPGQGARQHSAGTPPPQRKIAEFANILATLFPAFSHSEVAPKAGGIVKMLVNHAQVPTRVACYGCLLGCGGVSWTLSTRTPFGLSGHGGCQATRAFYRRLSMTRSTPKHAPKCRKSSNPKYTRAPPPSHGFSFSTPDRSPSLHITIPFAVVSTRLMPGM